MKTHAARPRGWRTVWLLLHRWAGLTLTLFLVVAGLTGSLLAFAPQLDAWLQRDLYAVPVTGPRMDPFELHRRAEALLAPAHLDFVTLDSDHPGEAVMFYATPEEASPVLMALALNPYTGEEIARFDAGDDAPLSRRSLLGFVFRLHFQLLLGEPGRWAFGIAALIWTLDCFVGFYLTLPVRRRREGPRTGRSFWALWKPAWLIRRGGSTWRLNFDFHRAAGLWTWALLFVFAVSAVSFNLPELYNPAQRWLGGRSDPSEQVPALPAPLAAPRTDWAQAAETGRRLLAERARAEGFTTGTGQGLYFDRTKGLFGYSAHTSRDVGGSTASVLWFDDSTGTDRGFASPLGMSGVNDFTTWVQYLHLGAIGGLAGRVAVSLMGFVITGLSLTGAYLWWARRGGRAVRA